MTPTARPGSEDQIPGASSRRWFLRIGGVGAMGAVAAACTKSTSTAKIKAQQTGNAPTTNPDAPPPTLGPTQATKAQQEADLANLRTATSMEFAIVDAYQALGSQVPVSAGSAFNEVVPVVVAHHRAAITALQNATRDALTTAQSGPNKSDFAALKADDVAYQPGKLKDATGAPDVHGNAWTWANIVEPALASIATPDDVLGFARQLESIAAATYAVATGIYSTIGLRQQAMAIGAVEARHAAKLAILQTPPVPGAPNALLFTRDGLGINALLSFDGKAAASKGG